MRKFTTIEEMEADSRRLKENACAVCIDTWEDRAENQKNHCKFGEGGICCRICSMGPCRITPKAPKGICGADAAAIAGRNYLRSIVGGSASHSDHGREIAYVLAGASRDGNYQITDEVKCALMAQEFGIETEGRDIYDVAHELAAAALGEYGKPYGTLTYLKRANKERQEVWAKSGVAPRAIDRECTESMHMTHMGNTADPSALVRQGLRTGLSDGWGGSMMGTDFSDILFGTPRPTQTEANLGVLEKDMVNIIVHGHDPALSEMIVLAAQMPQFVNRARELGAKGINIVGLCCTANEVAMRHGIPMAGNFLQQENAVLTGAVELIVVDVQCIFPALGPLSKCFHTHFVTTSPKAVIPDSTFIRFEPANAKKTAMDMISMAVENFVNRDQAKVFIPEHKEAATVGYSCESIIRELDGVTNSQVDDIGSYKPLIECLKSGVLRGAVGIVGCNNPRIRPDYSHIELMKSLIKNDILVVVTGCAAHAAGKAGLLSKEARELCGDGLKRVCELVDMPPVLHMGSCVDISRIMLLAAKVADQWGVDVPALPIVGCAPEWMSEKAVAIANYVVGTGLDTYLGVEPQVSGSDKMIELITEGTKEMVGAGFIIKTDTTQLTEAIINGIEAKRTALNI